MREISDIQAYVEHCRALLSDIEFALEDFADREQGWSFRYAVDFSEIYAFVLPRDHQGAPFSDGWSIGDAVLRQFFILSRFFGEQGILLPEPYAVELSGFIDQLATNEFSSAAAGYIEVLKDVQNVLALPKTERILNRARGADASSLSEADVDEIFGFFTEFAPNLVAFARGFDLTPFERLRSLFRQRQFVALESVVPELLKHVDENRKRERFEELMSRRKNAHAAANFVDAVALAHVEAANEILRERKERVLLVSRSSHMFSVIAASAEGPRDVFIRHPRSLPLVLDAATAPSRQELQARRASLQAFVEAAEEASARIASDSIAERDRHALRDLISRIEDEWASVGDYATALTSRGETETGAQSKRTLAIELLSAMREREQLRQRARDEIRAIFREVRRGHDTAAFRLQASTPSPSRGSVPYPIDFTDSGLRIATERVSERSFASLGDAETIFDLAIQVEDEYESLIGIALSLGAIGQWRVARHYIDHALVGRPQGMRGEGLFLRAITYNRVTMEAESFAAGVSRMTRALESVEAAIAEHGGIDPRYFNERAVLKLRLIELARSKGEELIDRQTLTIDQATAELTAALATEMSPKLRIQILNNLCHAYLAADDRERLAATLEQLESALAASYAGQTEWPAFVTDTVIHAAFRLHGDRATPEMLKAWSKELSEIASRADVSYQESRLIRTHATQIENMRRLRGD